MKLIFVRHCKTFNNENNKWSGQHDAQISLEGVSQLFTLKEKMSEFKIDKVYSSPLERCILTASVMVDNPKDIIVDRLLIERDFGILEGRRCNPRHKMKLGNCDLNTDLHLGVEKVQTMYYGRVKPIIRKIIRENPNKTVVIVGHSWIGRLLKFYSTNEKTKHVIYVPPVNAQPYVYEFPDVKKRTNNKTNIKLSSDNKLNKDIAH